MVPHPASRPRRHPGNLPRRRRRQSALSRTSSAGSPSGLSVSTARFAPGGAAPMTCRARRGRPKSSRPLLATVWSSSRRPESSKTRQPGYIASPIQWTPWMQRPTQVSGTQLERHGHPRLAAVAFALAWTRTRSNGCWMNFGGQKELDSLRHAAQLDADTTCRRFRSHSSGRGQPPWSCGVSQALIHAGLVEGLTPSTHGHDARLSGVG